MGALGSPGVRMVYSLSCALQAPRCPLRDCPLLPQSLPAAALCTCVVDGRPMGRSWKSSLYPQTRGPQALPSRCLSLTCQTCPRARTPPLTRFTFPIPKTPTPPHPHTLSADHGWSEMADFIAGESMPTSAYSGGLVAVYNRLYYTGGYVGSDAVKRYKQPSPASGWTTVGAMPSLASDGNQNAAASGEYLYMSESGFANSRYTRYTASTDSWTSGKPPRSPRA